MVYEQQEANFLLYHTQSNPLRGTQIYGNETSFKYIYYYIFSRTEKLNTEQFYLADYHFKHPKICC